MNAPEVVRRYAATLLETAAENQVLDQVQQDVEGLGATLEQSTELVEFLTNPLVDSQVQCRSLEELFSGKVQKLTLNLLLLMSQRRRADLIPQVLEAFLELAEERAGVMRAEVLSAVELSEAQVEQLRIRLAAYVGKEIRLQVQIDRSLKGGVVARVGDLVLDGSMATQLERLHKQLAGD
jgi:F-type H+-transporting ATPase subunit delta